MVSPIKTICRRKVVQLVLNVLFLLFTGTTAWSADEAKKVLALIDYIGGDYHNAVKDGQVVNPEEYQEMSEFSARVLEVFEQLKSKENGDKANIEKDLRALAEHIKNKSGESIVPHLARQIKDRLITTYNIVTYPKSVPSYSSGKTIYAQNCAQCHGESGKGDGPSRDSMNPKTPPPADFTDPQRIAGLSPFKAFNTASFGIEGTAMASFAALSEEQRWQAAFYILTLQFSDSAAQVGGRLLQEKKTATDLLAVSTLATHSNDQLLEKLKGYTAEESEARDMLAYLRRGYLQSVASDPLSIARGLVREAAALYSEGAKEKAYQKAVEAYLDGYELAEPMLFAKDAAFGRELETHFAQLRNAIRQGEPQEQIHKRQLEIEGKLDQAAQIMAQDNSFPGYYAFINSGLIILREGLEAALVLAAILAMLRVMGAGAAIRYVHLGWILALVAGGLTWLATETVMTLSGRHRESMEGFISVFAAVALFYVGYWLHTRSEAKKWQTFIHGKVQDLLSTKRIFGLVGISFFAVYREAFEVVLFYQALWLQNESNHGAILWGMAAGLAALALCTLAIFKLGLKIPLKYFFGATGTLLYLMAFIFAGNGIKELQAALWVPVTPLPGPQAIPLLGIYPTVETLAAQGLLLCTFAVTTYYLAKERKRA